MSKLYVGNLAYAATDADLKACFEQVGPVKSANIIMDRETGRSKGFGFVEMDDNDAKNAIEKLNSTDLLGRPINVNPAREREKSSGGRR